MSKPNPMWKTLMEKVEKQKQSSMALKRNEFWAEFDEKGKLRLLDQWQDGDTEPLLSKRQSYLEGDIRKIKITELKRR